MVPLQSLVRILPVHNPAIISRVDVGGQAALVTMQLLSNEVHLPCQCCLVASCPQIVSICWSAGVDGARIVVGPNLCWKLAGDHGHTGRGTEGRGAVRGVEDNRTGSQSVKVGGLDLGGRVMHLEEGRSQLVCHDVEDIWLVCLLRDGRVLFHAGHAWCCVLSRRQRDRVQIRGHFGSTNGKGKRNKEGEGEVRASFLRSPAFSCLRESFCFNKLLRLQVQMQE